MTGFPAILKASSDVLGIEAQAPGTGDEQYLTICRRRGRLDVSAWITQDGAHEAEAEMERQGWRCDVVPVEVVMPAAPGGASSTGESGRS